MALEHSPHTEFGKDIQLFAPAAAQWLHVAGDGLETICKKETEDFHAGDLWAANGGSDTCNIARFQFWKTRLTELGF